MEFWWWTLLSSVQYISHAKPAKVLKHNNKVNVPFLLRLGIGLNYILLCNGFKAVTVSCLQIISSLTACFSFLIGDTQKED